MSAVKRCGRHKRIGCMEYQCFSDRQRSRLYGDSSSVDSTGIVEATYGSTFSYDTDTCSPSTDSSSSTDTSCPTSE